MTEIITQKKIIFPGSQINHNNLTDINEKYFVYCSPFSAFVYNKSDLTLRNIIGDINDIYISAISLNKSPNIDILALYYSKDILIYNLITSKYSYSIPFKELKQMEFNKDSKLLLLNNKGELFITKVDYSRVNYINKVNIDDNFCNCFRWYPFNINEFAYSTNKNKIYYYSLLKNNNAENISIIDNIKNKFLSECVHIKDDENFNITIMDFYDLDINNKYLLVGTSNSKIYLVDISKYDITNKFNKYGKTPIEYIFWLNNQPGSFISINEKSEKYIKWNVSKSNYSSIKKLNDFNITSIKKYDDESNFLITNQNGEVFILNELNNKIKYIIKDTHYQSVFDLKINPNNEDLFITASHDGNIRLYSIKDNYKLIHVFNTNKNMNKNNNNCHITSLKWAPKYINLFASGDSMLNLRIFDIETKKQIILYKLVIHMNNIFIQGIDWNKYDNILVCANISLFLFSFVINNNEKDKYSLILLTELKMKNYIYNPIFESHNEYIITPSEVGNIYFYSTTNDKLGKIIDINSSPSKEIKAHKKKVNNIIFNNSKTLLATASDDMTIGLYDIVKSKETPMSKITHSINKYLVGQESQVKQILFLIDDTLLSGGKNGTICIWDIHKLQLKYKLNENISSINCISSFNKHPFLFITAGNDCSIIFWNLNYKMDLEKLLQIDRQNLKEIEKFIKYYFYEEDLDIFFDLLNEPIKEKKLVSKYLEKNEELKKEYSKYNNDSGTKNKVDFSIKKEEKELILDKLIKESAIIQEWELFCEFSILRNKWEDAICFAPKVSLDYWQQLMNKYEKYVNSENYISKENIDYNIQSDYDEKEIIALLNGNNYKKIVDLCIKKKDFQNALMIWLMEKSNKKEEKILNENNSGLNKDKNKNIINVNNNEKNNYIDYRINNLYNNKKLNFKSDENIKKIIDKESLIHLKEGKRIKSIINYIYYDDKRLLLKSLSKSNFIELGYLLSNDDKELKVFNDFFVIKLYEKYKMRINDNILLLLINKINDEDYKIILIQTISNKNILANVKLNKDKSELIKLLEKNDLSSIHKLINKYREECFNKLLDIFFDRDNKIKINEDEINKISLKLSDFLKLLILIKIKNIELNNDLLLDIVSIIIAIESLNYNYISIICLILEYFITKNIFYDKKDNNKKIYNFIFSFVNHIQNNYKENKIVIKYKFNQTQQEKYNLISSSYNNNIINFDNFNKVRNIIKFNVIYKCNSQEMKYYYLDNIYPKKVKNNDSLSSFSNTNIKSDIIKLNSGNYASLDEYLEMSKFINIKKI